MRNVNRPLAAAIQNEVVENARLAGLIDRDVESQLMCCTRWSWTDNGDDKLLIGVDENLTTADRKCIESFVFGQIPTVMALHPEFGGFIFETWEREVPMADVPVHESELFTDAWNAKRLVARHGGELRYCHPWRRWLVWDGKCWKKDDVGEVYRRAKDTVRAIYAEAAGAAVDAEAKRLSAWASRSLAKPRLDAMIALAESEEGIPVLPDQLDADPWLLNCENGTIDLRTGKLRPHDPADLITKLAGACYDPGAKAPTWLAFLDRIMAGSECMIQFLQRAVGYSLTGDTSERAMFVMWGSGANGKTTFLEAIRALLGDYATRTPTETLLARRGSIPNDIARLKGARLVTASESDEGRRLAEATIKDLTGGDIIAARHLYGEWFDFRPQCKLWLATNHRPVVRGVDKAIWDRIKLIPFVVTIPEPKQDKKLLSKLLAELPGILAWAVEGCLAWQREGLGVPDEVRNATGAYRAEMDVLGGFLTDCCVLTPEAEATSKALYEVYRGWCEANGERPIGKRAFGLRLAERGFTPFKGTGGRRKWLGVGLVAQVAYGGADSNKVPLFSLREGLSQNLRHHAPLTPLTDDDPLVRFAVDELGAQVMSN